MKKVLFIIPTLGNGGAEKSFISMLENLNSHKYEVDVFAIRPTGLIADMLPDYVNLLPLPQNLVNFKLEIKQSITAFLKKLDLLSAYNRIMYSYVLRKYEKTNKAEQFAFKYFKYGFKDCFAHYDVAVSYLEKTTNYLVSEVIDADVKIGYFHSDYNKLNLDNDIELKLIKNLDYLVTVSDNCADIIKESLYPFADKVRVVGNIISKDKILSSAMEENPYTDDFKGIRIVTAGRVSPEKGPDIAIEACRILVEKGYDIKWHIVGQVDDKNMPSLARSNGVSERLVFEGLQTNPYKFIYNSDIYVQPSRYEGKSMAIEEAKLLGVPIVTSAFTTASAQIKQNENGLIADAISPQAVADKIEELIEDKVLYSKIKQNLLKHISNEDEIKKLESLIDKDVDS